MVWRALCAGESSDRTVVVRIGSKGSPWNFCQNHTPRATRTTQPIAQNLFTRYFLVHITHQDLDPIELEAS